MAVLVYDHIVFITMFSGAAFAFVFAVASIATGNGKWPTPAAWARFLPIDAILVLVGAVVYPPGLLIVALLLSLGVTVPLFVLLLIAGARRVAALSKVQAKAAATARNGDPIVPFEGPVPTGVEAAAARLEALGFIRGKIGRGDGQAVLQLLFRAADSTSADVLFLPQSEGRPIVIELTSVLHGWRGVLSTTNRPTSARPWHGELLQVFLGATPEDLVRHHDRSLEYLRDRGITIDAFGQEEVPKMRAWGLRMSQGALAELPMREVARLHSRKGFREWLWVGPIEDNPRLPGKLAYLQRDDASLRTTPSA